MPILDRFERDLLRLLDFQHRVCLLRLTVLSVSCGFGLSFLIETSRSILPCLLMKLLLYFLDQLSFQLSQLCLRWMLFKSLILDVLLVHVCELWLVLKSDKFSLHQCCLICKMVWSTNKSIDFLRAIERAAQVFWRQYCRKWFEIRTKVWIVRLSSSCWDSILATRLLCCDASSDCLKSLDLL